MRRNTSYYEIFLMIFLYIATTCPTTNCSFVCPVNTAGLKGEAVTFYFTANVPYYGAIWRLHFRQGSSKLILHDNIIYVTGYSQAGLNNLRIDRLWPNHTGTYTFEFSLQKKVEVYCVVEVLMFESIPVITCNLTGTAVEGSIISFSCQVAYSGKWASEMTWTENDTVIYAQNLTSHASHATNNGVTRYDFQLNVTLSKRHTKYKCRAFFPATPSWVDLYNKLREDEARGVQMHYHRGRPTLVLETEQLIDDVLEVNDSSSDQCSNGGLFVMTNDSFSCSCLPGYTGRTCETSLEHSNTLISHVDNTDVTGHYSTLSKVTDSKDSSRKANLNLIAFWCGIALFILGVIIIFFMLFYRRIQVMQATAVTDPSGNTIPRNISSKSQQIPISTIPKPKSISSKNQQIPISTIPKPRSISSKSQQIPVSTIPKPFPKSRKTGRKTGRLTRVSKEPTGRKTEHLV